MPPIQPRGRFWRVREVPLEFSWLELEVVLRSHAALRLEEVAENPQEEGDCAGTDNGGRIRTIASDLCGNKVATIYFPTVPARLLALDGGSQLAIDIPAPTSEINITQTGVKRKRNSSQTVRLTIDRHFQGLTTLFAPDDDHHEIDILAVSGPGSHALESFVKQQDGNLWLSDNLPLDLPNARVMIYGFEGGLQQSTDHVDPEDHVSPIRVALGQLLQSKKQKPLILIGYSVGGLFIKEALIQIADSSPDLLRRIRGVLFFGVPNEGINLGEPQHLSPAADDQSTRCLLEWMSILTPSILRLQHQNFFPVQSLTGPRMFCFYETKPCPTVMQVKPLAGASGVGKSRLTSTQDLKTGHPSCLVSMSSAVSCLPNGIFSARSLPIDRSHVEIVKFYRDDREYQKIIKVLKQMAWQCVEDMRVATAIRPQLSPQGQRALLDTLRFEKRETQQTAINNADPETETGKWLLETPEYLEWLKPKRLAEHRGLLRIKGKPGAGKSTLMRFMLENARKTMKEMIVISYFFNPRGYELERSIVGMYRSLLLQLLERLPRLQDVFASLELGNQNLRGYQWTVESLKDLFEKAIRKIEGQSDVTCFIDALGDCDASQIQDVISFFAGLGHSALSGGFSLRVCFSSRHYQHIAMQHGLILVLDEQKGHHQDIQKYLDAELRIGHGALSERIRAECWRKTAGVFLWAVLVVYFMNEEYGAGRLLTLPYSLKQLPVGLDELFCELLASDSSDDSEVLLCIQMMLYARQPLSPQQLAHGIISGTKPYILSAHDSEVTAHEMFILHCSRGFAKVTKSDQPTVQFIHESITEFLLKRNGLGRIWPDYRENSEGRSHERLKRCCQGCWRLKLVGPVTSALRPQVDSMFPFTEYAVRNLLYHAEMAQSFGLDQETFISDFPVADWIVMDNLFEQDQARWHSEATTLLYILAERDLPHLIRKDPSVLSYLRTEDGRYGTPLLAALASGSDKALQAFLTAEVESQSHGSTRRWLLRNMKLQKGKNLASMGSDFKFSEQKGVISYLTEPANRRLFNILSYLDKIELDGSLFLEAAKNGNQDLAEQIMEDSRLPNVDLTDGDDKTALSLAAAGGHVAVVRMLLRAPGISIDRKDKNGRTPLSWAAGHGHEPVVKLLLERDVDVDSEDHSGRTPLSWAAGNGHVAIVDLFLDAEADVNSKDHAGQTPLTYAAMNGHKDAAQMLLAAPGVCVSLKDKIGCHLLLGGTGNGYEAIVKLLLARDGHVNSRDDTGQTPLIWAIINEHKIAVRMLLSAPGIDVNLKDTSGRTPLSWAAGNGYKAIVKILLDRGADANAKDHGGASPLIWATRRQQDEVFRFLFERDEVLLDQKDSLGRSPLSQAVQWCEKAAMLLLMAGPDRIDLNSRDKRGRTALSYAAERGGDHLIQCLMQSPGVEAEVADASGKTPLFWACNHLITAELLIDTGKFDLNRRDCQGRTLLSHAAGNGAGSLVQLLLKRVALVDSKDNDGRTPLSWAVGLIDDPSRRYYFKTIAIARRDPGGPGQTTPDHSSVARGVSTQPASTPASSGQAGPVLQGSWASPSWLRELERVVPLLLADVRVDPDSRDLQGRSPLSYAAEHGRTVQAQQLLATGKVDMSSEDKEGRTPLWYATNSDHEAIVDLLSAQSGAS